MSHNPETLDANSSQVLEDGVPYDQADQEGIQAEELDGDYGEPGEGDLPNAYEDPEVDPDVLGEIELGGKVTSLEFPEKRPENNSSSASSDEE